MIPYKKYNQLGDVHWKWYMGDNWGYRDLVNCSVEQFEGWHMKGTVVDVGCGDGVSSYILSNKGLRVIGIEPIIRGLEVAEEKLKYLKFTGICATIEQFVDDNDEEFDYLYSLNTIEHVDDPTAFVRLIKRVKNFGVIVTDNDATIKGYHPYHTQDFTRESLKELFKDFKVEDIKFSEPEIDRDFIGLKISNI